MATHQPSAESEGPKLPVGTVTFLFTDIEGSTQLVSTMGAAAWEPILLRHRAILRQAIGGNGGVEIQTEGDSIFAVFHHAPPAVTAAAAAQRALSAETWPGGVALRVRMGLHTGEGSLDGDGSYIGPDVHRAARIASAAHGGQVIVSDAVRALAAPSLPAGVGLLDLGEHRLKDLRPERLAQLLIEGLPSDFPPIKSLDARPNNLPTQLTSFVGRDHEIDDALKLLQRVRLLTLSGPGGTGKTRLSLQLAALASDDFPDGIWFVALEPIRDAALFATAIAKALNVALSGSRPALQVVAEAIGQKRMLVVLDNFEQVIDAAPMVAELLRACPELRVLVTSRVALHVSGEQEYQVPGLPAPPDFSRLSTLERENLPAALRNPAVEALGQFEAVRLFIARACSVRPDFVVSNENAPAIAAICAKLHGMPLAIELAAVRTKLLTPAQILTRLEKQLNLLTSGARDLPPRQQTLRGAIGWSYDLLDEPHRMLLERLSVFAGGWDIEAAEAVAGDGATDMLDGLTTLVDHSLVRRREEDGDVRFDMFPTIQEYAAEKLAERGESDSAAERHAAHFLAMTERAAEHLAGDDQRIWLDRLERDHDNIRAALSRSTDRPDAETAARLGFAAWRFWQKRGYLAEARARLAAMDAKRWNLPAPIEGRLLEALGGIAYWQADYPASMSWYDRALTIWHQSGDKREIANALYNRAFAEVIPIMRDPSIWSEARAGIERTAEIDRMCNEALVLFREIGDRVGEGNILWALGGSAYFTGRAAEARALYDESLAIFRTVGERTMEAWAEHMLSMTLLALDELDSARTAARNAIRHFHHAGDLAGVAMALDDLSAISVAGDDLPRAGRLHGAARHLQHSSGAELVAFVDAVFTSRTRATAQTALTEADLARYAAEGAAMPLDDVVKLALSD
ncbi:MAG: hypothetical protein KIS96_03065 [Bauldia sp.]|nr:hypothetical protein [Bauldia sp.]